ncbi:MAG TPA: diguanylate cyclase [Casimicrobiaceae bacterium]|nr:diguanylate cyclase [Casimicrobiaceae bacterium]
MPILLRLAEGRVSVDPAEGLRYAAEAAALAQSLGATTARAEALYLQGRCADARLDHVAALSAYSEALNLYEMLGDTHATARVLRAIGYVHDGLGDFPTALEFQLRALELDERNDDRAGRAATLRTIGVVYSKTGDIKAGLDYYRQSLDLAGHDADPVDRGKTLNNIGISLKNLGQLDEAREALSEAHDIFVATGSLFAQCATLNNLGLVHELSGRPAEAEASLREALDLCERIDNRAGLADAKLALGRLLSRSGRLGEGRGFLTSALDLCVRHGLRQVEAECHDALGDHYERAGELRAALDHMRRFHALEREVMSEAAGNKVRALHIQQQVASARREAELLRKQQEVLARTNAELDALNASLIEANLQRIALVDQLEQQTFEDALTGIANRRRLDLRLAEEFALARRHDRPLGVAIVDLDHFKAINDRFSHAVGDAVLRSFARLLVNQVRQTDLVARFGGEEFVLVLAHTDAEATRLVCEKVRSAVERYPWHELRPGVSLTASIGYCADTSVGSHERMLAIADRHLYQAKAAGRNCVRGEQPTEGSGKPS